MEFIGHVSSQTSSADSFSPRYSVQLAFRLQGTAVDIQLELALQ